VVDLREELQLGLGPSYTIEREIGSGGMATVFLARDMKHDRLVALKVLHRELALTVGPERFRREIAIAAKLQHPHILSVYDSGETSAGQLWFTMPYVEGESVRQRLRRDGLMPVDEALRVTREVASALTYAHQHGVVHRDIKPENILLTTQGDALLADFGIARASGAISVEGAPDTHEHLTETGYVVGTRAYMSPEQAYGAPVDARTDVFSVAVVCYEMLTGELPYSSAFMLAPGVERGAHQTPRARLRRPEVPVTVESAVRQALALDPANRYGSMAEFAVALGGESRVTAARSIRRGPVAAGILAFSLLIAAGSLFAWRRHAGASAPVGAGGGPPTVAVLAFENLGDSADAYFADGVTDEIRGKLTAIKGLQVIARASSMEYKRTTKTPQEIARELGARYLLTGQVRWEKTGAGKSRVRVNPELIDVSAGAVPTSKWQQPFDADLSDVFDVQADIAAKVASALNVALGAEQQHALAERETSNLAAYDAYLKGEAATQSMDAADPSSLRRGIAFYSQAVGLDSGYAQAWAALAIARAGLYFNGAHTPADSQAAHYAVARALALAPNRAETQLAVGNFERYVRLDDKRALAAIEKGLARAPDDVSLLNAASAWESGLGRWEAAVAHGERARALDPRSFDSARDLGFTLHYLRRYPEALAAYEQALALAPDNFLAIEYIAMIALSRGDLPQAQAVVQHALQTVDTASFFAFVSRSYDLYWVLDDAQQRHLLTLTPTAFDGDRSGWALALAQTYWLRGDTSDARAYADTARRVIEAALAVMPDDWQQQSLLGLALAIEGRKADAIRHGERGAELMSVSTDAQIGPYAQQILARIYMMVGEPDKALDHLEPLVQIPYYLSRAWLRIDPTWAPLRGNPRFTRLVAGEKPVA